MATNEPIDPLRVVDPTDYPTLFRNLLARSAEAALAALDPAAARLEADDRERCLYALGFALDLAEAWPTACTLTLTIAPHMEMQGYHREWIDFLEKALGQAAAQDDRRTCAQLHVLIGRLFQHMNEYGAAEQQLETARDLCAQGNDHRVLVTVLERLGANAMERSDFALARGYAQEALALLEPDDPATAPSHDILGLLALRQANWDEAIAQYTFVRLLRERQGVARFIAQAVRHLGYATMYAKRYDEALAYYQQALQIFAETGNTYEHALAQSDVGIVYWYRGQFEEALACYAAAEPVLTNSGGSLYLARVYNNRGLAQRDLGRYAQAHQSFAYSLELAHRAGSHFEAANVLESWGGLHLKQGAVETAKEYWAAALTELAQLQEQPKYLFELIQRRLREADETPTKSMVASPAPA